MINSRLFKPSWIQNSASGLWLMSVDINKDTKYLADNLAVNSWKNLFSSSNDANQATAANQPLNILNQLNGKPIVRFDGSNDSLVSNFNMSHLVNPNITAFQLSRWRIGGPASQAYWGNDNGFDRFALPANSAYGPGVSTGSAVTSVPELGAANQGNWKLFTFQMQNGVASGSKVWMDTGLIKTYTESHTGTQIATTTIGAINPTGGYSSVDFACFIAIPAILSDAVRLRIQRYIASVYGYTLT